MIKYEEVVTVMHEHTLTLQSNIARFLEIMSDEEIAKIKSYSLTEEEINFVEGYGCVHPVNRGGVDNVYYLGSEIFTVIKV